jgi:hypothetical protein
MIPVYSISFAREIVTDATVFRRWKRSGIWWRLQIGQGCVPAFPERDRPSPIPYTAAEAEDIIHVVDLCLRMLPARRAIA